MRIRLLFAFTLLAIVAPTARASFSFTWNAPGSVNAGQSYTVGVQAYFIPSNYNDPYAVLSLFRSGAQVGGGGAGAYSTATTSVTFTDNSPQTVSFSAEMHSYYGEAGYSSRSVTINASQPPANSAPVVTVSSNVSSLYVGQSAQIYVRGQDVDGNARYFNLDQVSPLNGYYGPGDSFSADFTPNNGGWDLGHDTGDYTRTVTMLFTAPGTYQWRGAVNDGSGWYYSGTNCTITVSPTPDTTAPAAPGLSGNPIFEITTSSFRLAWTVPQDNVGVTGYRVRLDSGGFIDVGNVLSYAFGNLAAGSSHTVEVQARDAAGNWSASASIAVTLSGGSSGGTAAAESLWRDLDGDGILDEIVRPNTAQFHYHVNTWYTANIAYQTYPINSAWLGWDFGWFDDGYSIFDGFSQVWSGPVFWVYFVTHFDMAFTLQAEANEPVDIYRDTSGSHEINPANWGAPLFHLPNGFSTGGSHSFSYPLPNAGDLPGTQYFLVKKGLPVGSVQFQDAVGAVLDEVSVNSTASVAIPASGHVFLGVKNTANQFLNAAHQVVWNILNTVGTVIRSGTGLDVNFNDLTNDQIALLVILLDNAPGKSVAIKSQIVKRVEFPGAFSQLTNYSTDFAGSGGTTYSPQGWALNGQNNPVALVKSAKPLAHVTLRINEPNKTFSLHGYSQSLHLTFDSGDITSTGSDQVVEVQSSADFPGSVGQLTGFISWSINLNGNFVPAGYSGNPPNDPHRLYVTWGSLGTGPTIKRMDWVASSADGASNASQIADSLYAKINSLKLFDPNNLQPSSGWALLDPNNTGYCDHIALLMAEAYNLIGSGGAAPAQVRRVMASVTAGPGNCLGENGYPKSRASGTEYLVLVFEPPSGGLNAFEGCTEAAGKYYAQALLENASDPNSPPLNLTAANDYAMLRAFGAKGVQQAWVRTNGIPPGSPGAIILEVVETGVSIP